MKIARSVSAVAMATFLSQQALLLFFAYGQPVLAAPRTFDSAKMEEELQKRFTKADADHDGKLTRVEAKEGMPRIYEHFDEVDTKHQGFVTLADVKAYAATRLARRREHSPSPL